MNTNFTELSMTEIQTIDGGWSWKKFGDICADICYVGSFVVSPELALVATVAYKAWDKYNS
ncbi:MAG TPA: hypothetical protein P5092_06750 [Ruminococcus sp.]|nr:hypothetical protein [Ruminococcus sp.]